MKKRKGPVSAGEFLDELEKDPKYIARMEEHEREKEKYRISFLKQTKNLNSDLLKAGVLIDSLADLVSTKKTYPPAIPVLLDYLKRRKDLDWDDNVQDALIRAISVKEARGIAGEELVKQFREERNERLRWVIGNAIGIVGTENEIEDIILLAMDESYGESRSELAIAMGRVLKLSAIPYLLQLLSAKEQLVQGTAITVLGELRAYETRSAIEPFLKHESSWVRNEAKKSIKKIDTYLKRMQKKLNQSLDEE